MKIALWIETKWGFGRFARVIQKYSRHTIDIADWSKPYQRDHFIGYDLVYTPVWYTCAQFRCFYPTPGVPVTFSIRGLAELFNYNLAAKGQRITNQEEVEHCRLLNEVRDYLNAQKIVSCVSRELVNLLRSQVTCELFHTPAGVEINEFYHPIQVKDSNILTVLCPFAQSIPWSKIHGYDVKRWGLVDQIRSMLPDTIQFLCLSRMYELEEMPLFYRQGDVILCLSHAEGNPYSLMEGGAAGAAPLSTVVGIAPELIQSGFNGQLLLQQDNEKLVIEAADMLKRWQANTDDLLQMRQNYQAMILATRGWESVVPRWDDFFEGAVQ